MNLGSHQCHCLFPDFTYRHKFTTFVTTILGTEHFAANLGVVVTNIDAENNTAESKVCDWKNGHYTDRDT